MKVGDYVRTDTGIIEKLEGIYEQNKTNKTIIKLNKMGGGRYAYVLDINSKSAEEFDKDFSRGNIIKSSPNIIDLIEVGDYVNGEKVDSKDEENVYVLGDFGYYAISKKSIKSVLTKEQFENCMYKIGE